MLGTYNFYLLSLLLFQVFNKTTFVFFRTPIRSSLEQLDSILFYLLYNYRRHSKIPGNLVQFYTPP